MRNYIGELRDAGVTWAQLSRETGRSARQLRRLASGESRLRSGTTTYEQIRNASRRISYRLTKESFGTQRAIDYRREALTERIREHRSVKDVKHKEPSTHWQIRIVGLFRRRNVTRIAEGFSPADYKINRDRMIDQAINDARFKLGSTGWELVRLLEVEEMQYRLGK